MFAFIVTNLDSSLECHAFLCPKRKVAQAATLLAVLLADLLASSSLYLVFLHLPVRGEALCLTPAQATLLLATAGGGCVAGSRVAWWLADTSWGCPLVVTLCMVVVAAPLHFGMAV